jgi:hypothetical protein
MPTMVDPDPPPFADTFDIEGKWEIVYSSEFYVEPVAGAPGTFEQPYQVHFDVVSAGDFGGVKFEGPFDSPDQPGVFYGQTLYNGRGAHLVHMVMRYDPNRYFQAHSGAHWPQEADDAVHVRGGWVDVGHQLTRKDPLRAPYRGLFRMRKL